MVISGIHIVLIYSIEFATLIQCICHCWIVGIGHKSALLKSALECNVPWNNAVHIYTCIYIYIHAYIYATIIYYYLNLFEIICILLLYL